jgi:hypothetical protein
VRLLRIILLVYFLLLAVMALFVLAAKPGPPGQLTQGVRLGAWQSERGTVYFSGQRLACEPAPAGTIYAERCRIEIAGQELDLLVGPRPSDLLTARGLCQATYAGREHPCALQSHHNWPAASVAYVSGGLDLSAEQLNAVRRRFPIENLPETTFLRGAMILWPATALALLGLVLSFLLQHMRRLNSMLMRRVVTFLTLTVTGVAALVGVPLALILLTRGFWD